MKEYIEYIEYILLDKARDSLNTKTRILKGEMMFYSPEENHNDSLINRLSKLSDEMTEFNDYCSFLCDAFGGILSKDFALDHDTINGVRLSTSWIKERSREIKENLDEVYEIVLVKTNHNQEIY